MTSQRGLELRYADKLPISSQTVIEAAKGADENRDVEGSKARHKRRTKSTRGIIIDLALGCRQ